MLNMPKASLSAMDRLVLWLGRSPTLGFAISRVAFALAATWQASAMFDADLDFVHVISLLQGAVWLWTFLGIAQHLLTPPLGLMLRPLTLIVDAIIFLTVIALCPPLQIPALACLFFVAWSASERFGRGSIIILALCLILAFLARGSYESWAAERHVAEVDRAIDGVTVLIGCSIAAAMLSMSILERRLISWSERLQAVGLSFQKSLPRFVVEQISELTAARYCAFLWQSGDGPIQCELIDGDGVRTVTLPVEQVQAVTGITPADTPFVYSGQSSHLLLRNRLGITRTEKAAPLMEAVSSLLGPGQGLSFHVHAGELRGRLYVGTRHGWSPAALLRASRIQEGLELFLERHFFLLAWRERTFAEARLALSRDLHDSVLQTLAALRVRLVTAQHGMAAIDAPQQLAELAAMEELVTAEQAHLRRLLNVTGSGPGDVDLVRDIETCCRFIALQWGIECRLNPIDHPMMVSSETAAEVEFLLREAAANAVKHAAAQHITVSLAQADDEILIALKDNPGAKPAEQQSYTGDFELQSQSIMKRLGKIGGTAYFHNLSLNSLISIRLPSSLPRSQI